MHAGQGQDSHSIQKSGSASFGCGASYSYRITEEDENPKKPSDKLGKVHCFGKSEFDYKAVDVSTQKRLIGNLWHNLIVDQYGNFAPSQTINSTSAPRGYQYKYDDGSV
jgi:hypothetical protein